MYAVIASGGKQYRVTVGQVLKLEKLDVEEGSEVTFDQVLMVSDGEDIRIGQPLLEGVVVKGTVLSQARDKKVTIVKFKRRKHSMKSMGHRQSFTEVEITQVDKHSKASEAKKPAAEKAEAKKPAAEKAEAKKPAAEKAEAKKPAAKKSEAKKPAAEKAEAKKPAAKKSEAKKPAAKKSEAKKPAAKKADTEK
jgi:large subunit ribosomal protein L21